MEETVPLLEQLAAQLNTTVEFLWDVLVRQAQVYVISHIVWWVIFAVSIWPAVWASKWFMRIMEGDETDETAGWVFFIALLLWVVVFITGIGNLLATEEFLTALLNPEYWALQQILEFIK